MKVKLFAALVIILIAMFVGHNMAGQPENDTSLSALVLDNVEALASVNSNCENGCLTPAGDCMCNGYQPYLEATWQ